MTIPRNLGEIGTFATTTGGIQNNVFTTCRSVGARETQVAIPAADINLNNGNYFSKTVTGNITFAVSNIPSSGTAASFVLDLTNGGAYTVTWFGGVDWPGGAAPTLTAAGRDVLGFFTYDGGSTWTGLLLGQDVK